MFGKDKSGKDKNKKSSRKKSVKTSKPKPSRKMVMVAYGREKLGDTIGIELSDEDYTEIAEAWYDDMQNGDVETAVIDDAVKEWFDSTFAFKIIRIDE